MNKILIMSLVLVISYNPYKIFLSRNENRLKRLANLKIKPSLVLNSI